MGGKIVDSPGFDSGGKLEGFPTPAFTRYRRRQNIDTPVVKREGGGEGGREREEERGGERERERERERQTNRKTNRKKVWRTDI